jgi:GNAT superfamily N-acetyltransferase
LIHLVAGSTHAVTNDELRIVEVADPDTIRRIQRLRAECWMTTGLPATVFPDGQWRDPGEEKPPFRHWAAFAGARLVAAGRLSIHERLEEAPGGHLFAQLPVAITPPIASINRLVVHPDVRRQGLSRRFDDIRLAAARAAGARTVLAYWSRVTGLARYRSLEALGFRRVSDFDFFNEPPTGLVTAMVLSWLPPS